MKKLCRAAGQHKTQKHCMMTLGALSLLFAPAPVAHPNEHAGVKSSSVKSSMGLDYVKQGSTTHACAAQPNEPAGACVMHHGQASLKANVLQVWCHQYDCFVRMSASNGTGGMSIKTDCMPVETSPALLQSSWTGAWPPTASQRPRPHRSTTLCSATDTWSSAASGF